MWLVAMAIWKSCCICDFCSSDKDLHSGAVLNGRLGKRHEERAAAGALEVTIFFTNFQLLELGIPSGFAKVLLLLFAMEIN